MIVELNVENLAIIERSRVQFGAGFTAVTGETGAGKSLLIDAIELALGERADSDLVRTGSRSASVHVVLDLSAVPALAEEAGFSLEEGKLVIHREVLSEGRSTCRINGKQIPVGSLRVLGKLLIDLHGQHDHQSLFDADRHLGFLDEWIGEPAFTLLQKVSAAYAELIEARRKLHSLRSHLRDREMKLDILRHQINEIEGVQPEAEEMASLEAQLGRLKHAERLQMSTSEAIGQLADNEACATDQTASALKNLEDAVRFDPDLDRLLTPLREAHILLQEATYALRDYLESLEGDPAELENIAARIDSLRKLRRKYGESEAEVLEFLSRAREELAVLEDSTANEETLSLQVSTAEKDLQELSASLSIVRKEKGIEFGRRVQDQLRDLAMESAIFEVRIEPKEATSDGTDQVEFYFSANRGEKPKPLTRIASGGEVSRVMLAIKTASAGRAGVPTLIFDEVDAGLGGRAAATVAKKLQELSRHCQVIVISHLPQIAARANDHFHIEKVEDSGRVVTQVRKLDPSGRIEELARMLAGDKLTPSALANAREMLEAD